MPFEQPSFAEKTDFFAKLNELGGDDSEHDYDALEEQDGLVRRQFFHPREAALKELQEPEPMAITAKEIQIQIQIHPSTSAVEHSNTAKETIIKATPLNLMRRRLSGLLGQDDTVVPDSTRPVPKRTPSLGRSSTTDSPLMNLKKRKRDLMKLRPDQEQIFKGLSFYYVPNDDIAPARRLRINKAREYGALWTRDVASATHVVVDKGIQYKDLETLLVGRQAVVVREDYPVDCIRFKAMLDGTQNKYAVPGRPDVLDEGKGKGEEATSSEESTKSLQIKPQHGNSRRWDYVPPLGTPLRTVESTPPEDSPRVNLRLDGEEHAGERGIISEELGASEKSRLPGKEGSEKNASKVDDELSQYISMVQEFKHLPLDNDDDATEQMDIHSDEEQERVSSGDERSSAKLGKKRRVYSKTTRFEDKFACNQAGAQDAYQNNPNARTVEVLQSMADYYERINDHWRTTGYRKAITTLKRQASRITTEDEAFQLPHIGRRIAQKIEEIVTTNKLQRLDYAQDEPTNAALQTFLQIYGVGNKQAQQWISQGLRTLEDVKTKAKLNPSQRIGVEHFDDLNSRIPRREVEALGAVVREASARMDPEVELIVGGSYRRGSESSNDIDLIVTKLGTDSVAQLRPFLSELVRVLEAEGFLTARLATFHSGGDGSKWHGCCALPRARAVDGKPNGTDGGGGGDTDYRPIWRRIDFLLVPESEMGGALIYFTGNDIFNRSIRLLASKKGMRLNQRGLYKDVIRGQNRLRITEGELVEGRDERKIFEILGVKWREPHERWC